MTKLEIWFVHDPDLGVTKVAFNDGYGGGVIMDRYSDNPPPATKGFIAHMCLYVKVAQLAGGAAAWFPVDDWPTSSVDQAAVKSLDWRDRLFGKNLWDRGVPAENQLFPRIERNKKAYRCLNEKILPQKNIVVWLDGHLATETDITKILNEARNKCVGKAGRDGFERLRPPVPDRDQTDTPDSIQSKIESAERYESIGDAWDAARVYDQFVAELESNGDQALASEMKKRAKINRSAAAQMMRGHSGETNRSEDLNEVAQSASPVPGENRVSTEAVASSMNRDGTTGSVPNGGFTDGEVITAAIVGPEKAETILKRIAGGTTDLRNKEREVAVSWLEEKLKSEIENSIQRFRRGGTTNEDRMDACLAKVVADVLERELANFMWNVQELGGEHPVDIFRRTVKAFIDLEKNRFK